MGDSAAETRARLQRSGEAEWAIVGELLPHAVYVFYLDERRGEHLNGHLASALGYGVRELEQVSLLELLHPEDVARLPDQLARWLQAGHDDVLESEYRLKHKDGGYRWFLSRDRVFTRDEQGRPTALLGTAIEVTARKVFEQDRMRAERLEAIGRLAGGVAHDFNNLLSVIRSSASLAGRQVRRGQLPAREIEEIDLAAREAALLTRQLLALSRHDAAPDAEVDAATVLGDAGPLLRRLIEEHIDLVFAIDEGVPPVRFARSNLMQIVLNLAVNARDAMPSGGKLTIGLSIDAASTAEGTEWVTIRVSDTGEGIPDGVVERIFEPFFSTKRELGTGIGLSTVDQLVRRAGGHVSVMSRVGEGTTFLVRLPPAAAAEVPKVETSAVLASGRGQTLLLVEDSELVRRVTKTLLEDAGYQVVTAKDGAEALRLLHEREFRFDLVLCDVVLPKLSGFVVADEVLAKKPELPMLLWSGYPDRTPRGQSRLPVLEKPVEPAQLIEAIRKRLADEPAQPALGAASNPAKK